MDTFYLIEKINSLNSDKFIEWYCQMIQSNTNSSLEQQLFTQAIIDNTINRYYKIFKHLEKYIPDDISEYNDLISLITPDKKYFVELARQELINKLSSNKNTYLITLSDKYNHTTRFITEQISYRQHIQNCYEIESNEFIELNFEFYEHKIIKVIDNSNKYMNYLASNSIIKFIQNLNEKIYYGFEIKDCGIINYNFTDLIIKVELYN